VDAEQKAAEEAGKGEQHALPIAEAVPAQPPVEPVAPLVPPPAQGELPAAPAQRQPTGEPAPARKPITVQIVGSGELSAFERTTIRYAGAGILVAFLALIAASVTGYFIYQQYQAMEEANEVAGLSANKARYDARSNDAATAHQLAILQGQLIQQRQSSEMGQRPWVKFELGGTPSPGTDPTSRTLPALVAGQPLEIPVRMTNIGNTTAEKLRGGLLIQIVPDDKEPVIPRNRLIFPLPGEPKVPGKSMPGEYLFRATLYPNEVAESSFSRLKADGSKDPVTSSEVTAITAGTSHIYLVGQVWYYDIFGVLHWTKFCETSVAKTVKYSTVLKCVRFGGVDNNQSKNSGSK
jgi:hypothetical protein